MPRLGHTTFILGAGASFHAGYPFVGCMGKQLLNWMRRPRESIAFDFDQCADLLEERFGEQIEDIFKGIDAEIKRRSPDYPIFANYHKPALIEAMRQWFAEIHQQHTAPAYTRFAAEVVRPGDRIITFNYDVSLDSELRGSGKWSVGDGYGFDAEGLPRGSTVSILKLHGSINWFAPLFGGRTGMFAMPHDGAFGNRPVFPDGDLAALGYVGITDPSFPRPYSAAIQPMILPTERKEFFFQTNLGREWSQFWNRLWTRARRAVRSSTRIVVCGYGLQPIDRRGCNLLLTGDVPCVVEVCCGRDTGRIANQLRTRGRTVHEAQQVFFEDWVSAHVRTAV
jgi:hypothetical protein